jgi:ADP-ribosylglycohydrolase
MSSAEYRRRMQGGWIGQIVGVGWALPTEFKFPSKIVPEAAVPEWKPERIDQHFNDDIFFNIGLLQLMKTAGLDAPRRAVALHWLNAGGRRAGNTAWRGRTGIAPPDLAHPHYGGKWSYANLHMFSDAPGLVSPGMPRRAAELIDRFTMKSCATRYDGRFMAAMTAEAFFTTDLHALIESALRVVPRESQYAECIRDVVRWHKEDPQDWQATWRRIQTKYFDDADYLHGLDPGPGTADAKIHAAYAVLGMLYGEGDFEKSIVLTMRCGQDSDCSASNVGGILGVMLGADGIPARFTEKLDMKRAFNHVGWNLAQVYEECEALTKQIVAVAGDGPELWRLADIDWEPGPYERWWDPPSLTGSRFTDGEMRQLKVVALSWAMPRSLPGWKAKNCRWSSGYQWERQGRSDVVILEPGNPARPVVLTCQLDVPARDAVQYTFGAGGDRPWRLELRIDGKAVSVTEIGTDASEFWTDVAVDLAAWRGRRVTLELAASVPEVQIPAGQRRRPAPPDICLTGLPGQVIDEAKQ